MKRLLPGLILLLSCLVATPAEAEAAPQLADSFDGAYHGDATYGLNDALATRQSGTARGVTYTRVSGSWETSATPPPHFSQVNHPDFPGKLVFALPRSAVRLDAPLAGDTYTVSATVDPVSDWSSIMLSRSAASTGYVTNADVQLGITVSRDGQVQAFRAGAPQWSAPLQATKAAQGFRVTLAVTGPSVTVTVNGAARTLALGSALAGPYLYLGAYSTATVDDLAVSRVSRFADSFDGAVNADPGYGLNDSLGGRQSPLNTSTYTRVSGSWTTLDPPPPYYSQVNHHDYPGKLVFAVDKSAVRLDAPVTGDALSVSATVDPAGGSSDWSSIMLSRNADSSGYVTNGNVQLGLTVARDGQVQLFRAGVPLWPSPLVATRSAIGFAVSITVTGASSANPSVAVSVNGVGRTSALGASLGATPYLFLGALVGGTVDDLAISRVDPYPNLAYYGYYTVRALQSWGGNHIDEAKGFANLHWVNVSPDWDTGGPYRVEELAKCPPRSCALYVGEEFFPPATCTWGNCPIDPTLARWRAFVQKVKPYNDRIAAIYLKDEPHSYHVSNADIQTMASEVKAAMGPGFGPFPIMLTLAGGDVTPNVFIPDEVDWVGVDDYHADAARLDTLIAMLEKVNDVQRRVYLFPPTVVASYTRPEYDTAAKVEAVQQVYFDAARRHPSVIAIMNFGMWVNIDGTLTLPNQVPGVWAAQERLGVAVTLKN